MFPRTQHPDRTLNKRNPEGLSSFLFKSSRPARKMVAQNPASWIRHHAPRGPAATQTDGVQTRPAPPTRSDQKNAVQTGSYGTNFREAEPALSTFDNKILNVTSNIGDKAAVVTIGSE